MNRSHGEDWYRVSCTGDYEAAWRGVLSTSVIRLAINKEELTNYTSSVPSVSMLAALQEMCPLWEFRDVSLRPFAIPGYNASKWRRAPDTALKLALAILGKDPNRLVNVPPADVFLRFDAGTFGPRGQPLISLIADLSSIHLGRSSSLRWDGRRMFDAGLRASIRMAARIVAISEHTRCTVARLFPEAEAKLIVIHNGLAPDWFRPSSDRSSKELPAERRYWIWYGQITPRKNIERLLRAYGHLLRAHAAFRKVPDLVMVTKAGAGRGIAHRLVRELRLEDRVRFVDPVTLPELVELVRSSVGVVFPSLYEGFGMPVVEGMAVGVPVLTSNVTAMPEVAGGQAILVDPYDVASIARGMTELLEPALWSADRVAARRNWAQRFTAQRAAEAYAELIEEVVEESRRKRGAWSQ